MILDNDYTWLTRGACRTFPPDMFLPPSGAPAAEVDMARAVCESCPVQGPCLENAIRNNLPGIHAGTTGRQRRRIKQQRRALQAAA